MQRQSILVTGASSGIGAALALKLASPHRLLGLCGRNRERLASVAARCRASGARVHEGAFDLKDTDRLATYVAEVDALHPIDTVILNAGILGGRPGDAPVESATTAREVLETNLVAPVSAIGLVLPRLQARGRGQIILVGSLASLIALPDAPAYSAAKAGLLFFGSALREAVRRQGISVTVACPGYVATPMTSAHMGARPHEIPAAEAAELILRGADRDREVIGFPRSLFWQVQLGRLAPEFLRRIGQRGQRFHVANRPG